MVVIYEAHEFSCIQASLFERSHVLGWVQQTSSIVYSMPTFNVYHAQNIMLPLLTTENHIAHITFRSLKYCKVKWLKSEYLHHTHEETVTIKNQQYSLRYHKICWIWTFGSTGRGYLVEVSRISYIKMSALCVPLSAALVKSAIFQELYTLSINTFFFYPCSISQKAMAWLLWCQLIFFFMFFRNGVITIFIKKV